MQAPVLLSIIRLNYYEQIEGCILKVLDVGT
jgi:hypothetical protein